MRYLLQLKVVDYNTFRIVANDTLGNSGGKLGILDYNDYINKHVDEPEISVKEYARGTTILPQDLDDEDFLVDNRQIKLLCF